MFIGPPRSSTAERDALANIRVEQHRGEQHRTQEDAVPVVVDAGIADADLHHAEDQRTDRSADHRAVATTQEAAADHRRNYGLEFFLQTAVGGGRTGIRDLQYG